MDKSSIQRSGIKGKNNMNVFSIKISLQGIRPQIFRRIEVPCDLTLHDLHLVIQAAMGWENYHLYEFKIGNKIFTSNPDKWPRFPEFHGLPVYDDSESAYINEIALMGENTKIVYRYDFGDEWVHTVKIEKVIPAVKGVYYPRCVAGKRACPPEDSGGAYGYLNMLDVLKDPKNKEYDEIKNWLSEYFDPEYFNVEEANKRLRNYLNMDHDL